MAIKPYSSTIARTLVALALALACAGCPQNHQEITALPAPSSAKPIAPGETVSAEFPPDNLWHASGFYARPGDLLRFKPVGEAAYVTNKALLVHIGRTSAQMVHGEGAQQVTQSGEIFFRTDSRYLGPYPDPSITIQIKNERQKIE